MLALKEMDETLLPAKDRPDIVKAFQREADLLKRLDHPHIVKVYDSFQESEKHYMAMDLVQGRTLEKMMETSPGGFPEARVLPWAEQLCDTLEYLHNLNPPIIYRDMKPGNVMVEDASGQIKVVDFGIAREFKGGKKKGDTIKFGTDGYAPPEQYTDSKGETRPCSDVYALAAMLYHLISGDDPTSHPFKFDFLLFHRPPVSASKHVVDALTKALEMEMGKRFQTMAEFKAALTGQAAPKAKKKSAGPAAQAGPSSQGQPIISPPSFAPPVPAPPRAVGGLQVSTSRIDMSRVEKGGIPPVPQSFTVSLPGGDVAQVSAQDAWLTVSPATAGDKQSVEVSVRTDMLTLDSPHWDAPNILKPFVVTALAAAISAWWISVPVLIAGIWWRWIWQGLALIFGGAAGIQLTMWLVSWLLPHTIARPADHTGSVIVSDGPVKNTITIKATAVPSTWRRVMGWSTMALATVAETGISTGALWWLIEGLGRWWR
jgi:serine/threonine protein kinase